MENPQQAKNEQQSIQSPVEGLVENIKSKDEIIHYQNIAINGLRDLVTGLPRCMHT